MIPSKNEVPISAKEVQSFLEMMLEQSEEILKKLIQEKRDLLTQIHKDEDSDIKVVKDSVLEARKAYQGIRPYHSITLEVRTIIKSREILQPRKPRKGLAENHMK